MKNFDFKKYCLILVSVVLFSSNVLAQSGAWTKKADIPTPRAGASASVVDGKIYVIGGTTDGLIYPDLNVNEVYDPSTNTWEIKAPMPTARGFLTTVVLDGIIYAIGGGYSQPTKKVEAYDPLTDSWTTKADLLNPRLGSKAVVVDGKIYNIGGNYSSRNCEVYDPKVDVWTKKSDMPGSGGAIAATAYNGLIYVIGGGFYGLASYYGIFSSVYIYNPKTDTWTQGNDMPTPRFGLETYLANGKIFAFGGSKDQNTALSTIEVYDPVNNAWTIQPNMSNEIAWFAGTVINNKIYIIGGTKNWAIGLPEVWEYETNFLEGWLNQNPLSLENDLEDVDFIDANIGTAVGRGIILRTDDGGNNWNRQFNDTTKWLQGISFTDKNNGIAVGYDDNGIGIILRTTDGGNTWFNQYSGIGYLRAVSFIDINTATVVGDTILKTTDGGRNWYGQSIGRTEGLQDVCFTDANNGTAVGCDGIFRTTDGGNHWFNQRAGIFTGVSFIDENIGTVVGIGDSIFRTTDGGKNWISQSIGLENVTLWDVCFTDEGNGTVVGGRWTGNENSEGIILRTTDGGNHWVNQSSGITRMLNGVCFTDSNNGTIVGVNGIILRTTTGGVTSVKETLINKIPKDYMLYQNYPNPFNPNTSIQFSVNSTEFVSLKVYDILGREIATLVNEEKPKGIYKIDWNANKVSSGVYFYQLKIHNYTETKKMILLR